MWQLLPEFLSTIPQHLESKIVKELNKIPSQIIKDIKETLIRAESSALPKEFKDIKRLNDELKMLQDEIDGLNTDEYTKNKKEEINEQKRECEKKRGVYEIRMKEHTQKLEKFENDKKEFEKEIYRLEASISTERIDKKLKILENLKKCIEKYKEKLVNKLREELHDKILEKYKLILPNDNINELEIGEDFEIKFKDSDGDLIIVESQSSGQKQILAICIFWALSELSNSQIPLIIDTPLSRIDATNRANIIKHYYAKGGQVIILPHSGEIGTKEYKYAEPYLAGLYKIFNDDDRGHARIETADISEIL